MIFANPGSPDSLITFKSQYQNYIGGEWVAPVGGQYFDNVSPVNGAVFCQVPRSDQRDIDLALDAAHAAREAWGKTSVTERSNILLKMADRVEANLEMLAVAETWDNGKAVRETLAADVPLVADHFRYFAGCIRADEGSTADIDANTVSYHFNEPLGVVGQIIPWNFPLLMAAWKLAPALAAGNACVLKPAEQTSLTALLLAEVIKEAGLPKGAVNIVTGAGETGHALVTHPDVNKVAFTGSTDIGKLIAKNIANHNKKLTLELGGKSAHIVFEDAAIDQAVEGVVNGIYFNQGHVCCAGSRLIVEESIADVFIKKLKKRISTIRLGNPMDKNTDIGAINSKEQLDKIKELVAIGKKEGGTFFEPEISVPRKGYFHKPCFFENCSNSDTIAKVEIFGPVLSIMTFRTPEEAIAKANNTPYGLAAGIWSEKGSKIHSTANKLKAGVIWANTYNKFDAASPFGGFKESGYGREGGRHGILPYLEIC